MYQVHSHCTFPPPQPKFAFQKSIIVYKTQYVIPLLSTGNGKNGLQVEAIIGPQWPESGVGLEIRSSKPRELEMRTK
jgi:hypothetical protein